MMFCLLTLMTARAQDRVEASLGVWLAPSDTASMGGAGIGLASGASGLYLVPAAAASRRTHQTGVFSATGTLAFMRVGAGDPVDLGNTGLGEASWEGISANIGGAAAIGPMGLGVAARALRYTDEEGQQVSLYQAHSGLAARARGGRFVVGAGLRPLVLDASVSNVEATWWGMGAEAGLQVVSGRSGWSAGLGWRSQVIAAADEGELIGVNEAVMPAQVTLGGAWTSRESMSWARHLVVVADAELTGRVEDGVALEPLIHGAVLSKGEAVTLTPKLGAECEVWPDRLKVQVGSYYEAARTEAAPSRLHGTGGAEVRLVHMEGFRGLLDHDVSWAVSADVADRYNNIGFLSFRFWRPTSLLVD